MSRPRRPTPTVSLFRRYVSNAVQGLSKAREGSRNLAHVLFFLHSKEFVEKLTSSRASWFQSHVTEFNLTCMLKSERARGGCSRPPPLKFASLFGIHPLLSLLRLFLPNSLTLNCGNVAEKREQDAARSAASLGRPADRPTD